MHDAGNNGRSAGCVDLATRGAFTSAPLLTFLRTRALPGVERCDGDAYARTLTVHGAAGSVAILVAPQSARLHYSVELAPSLPHLVTAVRGAFNLDADMTVVDSHLAIDASLRADVGREPGVRVPGMLDGFECAIRAVLGQQITVAGARTLTMRLVTAFGTPLTSTFVGLTQLFPGAEALANAGAASIATIGLPRKRAATLHALAVACCEGQLPLSRDNIAGGRAALARIPGVGPWTVEYVALRALGDRDAYPTGDVALARALGRKGDSLEYLRPWRAYAAIRLWRRLSTSAAVA